MVFLSEDNFFLNVKFTLWGIPTFLTLTWVRSNVRPEVNTEPTHFLTLMNNGKAFSSLDGMACSYQCSEQFQFLLGHWQVKRYWIPWDLKKPNLFNNNLNNTRNNTKSRIQNKKNGGIVELLIPTLNKLLVAAATREVL